MQEENNQIPAAGGEEQEITNAGSNSGAQPSQKPPFFVFNFNTLLGLIAIAIAAVTGFLALSSRQENRETPVISVQKPSGKSISVVFVNTDSINERYEFVKSLRKELENTGKRLHTEVTAEQSALEKEAADLQRQMAASQITEDKAKTVYEQLMQRQQALMEKKDQYTQMIAEQELQMNIRLVDTVTAFLKRFNKNYQFDYIFGYKTAGEILVANDTLDITAPVIDALNQEYRLRKK